MSGKTTMRTGVVVKALAIWFGILVLAVLNGWIRQAVLIPGWGMVAGQAASGILLAAMILAVAIGTVRWFGPCSMKTYWAIGLCWLILTLVFEFAFGRLVRNQDWMSMLQAYTFQDGNLWPIVLLVTVVSPALAARIRRMV